MNQKILFVEDESALSRKEKLQLEELGYSVRTFNSREMERDLQESVLRHHELVAQIPVGVYIVWIRTNGKREFEYLSDRWCEIHGVSRETVLADSSAVDNLLHPDDRDSFIECNRLAARARKPFLWEGRFFTANGKVRWLRIESTPRVHENGDIRWFGVSQDITERKQVEEELREARERAARIIEDGPIAITQLDINGTITLANNQAQRLLELKRSEIGAVGYDSPDWQITDIDGAPFPDERLPFQRVMSTGKSVYDVEHAISKAGTEKIMLSINGAPLHDSQGKLNGAIFAIQDVTERKRSEQAIQKLLTEKETLINEIQHRIKNNINTMTSLLSLQAQTLEEPTAIAALEDARNRMNSLGELYDYLHSANTREQGSLGEYLQQLVESEVKLFPHGKHVELHAEIEECLCAARKLSTVGLIVNELVTNAMKYAFQDHPNPKIAITGVHQGDRYVLTVEDNGIGIAESVTKQSSSGFGTMIIDALTEQLDGTIEIRSDKGTHVSLDFPIKKES